MQPTRIELILKDPFQDILGVTNASIFCIKSQHLLFFPSEKELPGHWPGLLSDLRSTRGAISVVIFENVCWYNFATFSPFLSYPWWRTRVVEARGFAH